MKKQLDMLQELKQNINAIAGQDAGGKVMKGIETLKPSVNKVKLAQWVKEAIIKLDSNVSEKDASAIMHKCGENCAKHNSWAIEALKKKRAKFTSLEAFLAAEEQDPQKGTKIQRERSAIIQSYLPQTFTRPMRCFCSLVNGLPESQVMSKTYCQCSKALVQKVWEGVIGKPVQVEIMQTALSGGMECKFRITN